MSEKINHPSHYNIPGKKECIEQMREDFGDSIVAIFCLTNAYKYLYRAGMKDGESQKDDIAKAKWCYNYQQSHLYSVINSTLEKTIGEELEKYEQS